MIIIIIVILLILLIIYNSYNKTNNLKSSNCWIESSKFPEAQQIFDSRNIIIDELMNVLNSDKWSVWSSDYKSTPIFTKMSNDEILEKLLSSYGKINSNKEPSWRLYGLILNKQILPTSEACPNTLNLLKQSSSRILNAGFSIIEPGCYIGEHRDYNDKFYRLHIPLIIPKVNNDNKSNFITKKLSEELCVLQVENDYRIWQKDDFFIFDDTCIHNAWNNTDEIRIVLLVDLLK